MASLIDSWRKFMFVKDQEGETPQDQIALDPSPTERYQAELDEEQRRLKKQQEDDEIVAFVEQQFKYAADTRYQQELDWALGLAFSEGRQWLAKSVGGASLQARITSLINEEEVRRYLTFDKMSPLLYKVESMVLLSQPDVKIVPLDSDDEIDVQAAKQAESIRAYCARKFDRPTQTRARLNTCLKTSTSWLKIYWDKNGESENAVYSSLVGGDVRFEKQRTGAVCEDVLPPFEVYLDPLARTWEQVRWLVHAKTQPLSWFVNKFGELGKTVQPDAMMRGMSGYVDQYLDGIEGGFGAPANTSPGMAKMNAAVVKEYWELPSAKFPRGRYVVVAGRVVLFAGEWPYPFKYEFPFIPLGWKPQMGNPYHISLACELSQLQLTLNRVMSSTLEQMENQADYIANPMGSGVGPDEFEGRKRTTVVYDYMPGNGLEGGGQPVMSRSPGISTERFALADRLEAAMRDIAGVHDVTDGLAPAGTPAEAIRLLQQADQTQHAHMRSEIEKSAVKIAEWEVALYTQFAPAPIAAMVDMENNEMGEDAGGMEGEGMGATPQSMGANVIDFAPLREGGQFRVIYRPSSGVPESPDQKNERIMGTIMFLANLPDPSLRAMAADLLDMPESHKVKKYLGQMAQDQQAQQEAMMQQQQAMMQMQSQAEVDTHAQKEQISAGIRGQEAQNMARLEMEKLGTTKALNTEEALALHNLGLDEADSARKRGQPNKTGRTDAMSKGGAGKK